METHACWFAIEIHLMGKIPVLVNKIEGTLTVWLEPVLREW
nr:MAG TPA: hypothetical protein [Caudoviricetes sp.]